MRERLRLRWSSGDVLTEVINSCQRRAREKQSSLICALLLSKEEQANYWLNRAGTDCSCQKGQSHLLDIKVHSYHSTKKMGWGGLEVAGEQYSMCK